MRVIAVILGLILIGIAVLAGGCSIVFTPVIFQLGASDIWPIWAAGLFTGVFCLWAGAAAIRAAAGDNTRKEQLPSELTDPPSEDHDERLR